MLSLGDIVHRLGGELVGDETLTVERLAPLDQAERGCISFLSDHRYRPRLASTRASAVVLSPADRDATVLPRIVTHDPYHYFARLAQLFAPPPRGPDGVHASAVVAASARLGRGVGIGAGATLGEGSVLGNNVVIGAGCHIGDDVVLGDGCFLHPGVVIYHGCRLGQRVLVHAGAVIGADGFGFAATGAGQWEKIPQTGRVLIGDDVEIGANTTIDRGTLGDTVVEEGVKIDNLVHLAHNVHVGAHTAMAACVGVAGSTRIGRHCQIGGAAGIIGHLSLADHIILAAGTILTQSIDEAGSYAATLPAQPLRRALRSAAHYRRLDQLASRVAELERQLAGQTSKNS